MKRFFGFWIFFYDTELKFRPIARNICNQIKRRSDKKKENERNYTSIYLKCLSKQKIFFPLFILSLCFSHTLSLFRLFTKKIGFNLIKQFPDSYIIKVVRTPDISLNGSSHSSETEWLNYNFDEILQSYVRSSFTLTAISV